MANEDERSQIRREYDREWLLNLQHQVVTLMAFCPTLEKKFIEEMGEINETLKAMDFILRGDPLRGMDGIITQILMMRKDLDELKREIYPDAAGNPGALEDIKTLKSGEKKSGFRWKFWTVIVGGTLTVLGANWDRIVSFTKAPGKDAMLDDAKRPRRHHKAQE